MRLINTESYILEEFIGDKVPPYAILSHTWGDEEVSLQDFQQPNARRKAGYWKIERTCEEARTRNIKYAWVDTCCIDKTSSAELSEAINSMFRWYEKADICFAYLADVTTITLPDFNTLFAKSRWFTRGWTLQELLAPENLQFFSSQWLPIASRDQLASRISTITSIREIYLLPDEMCMVQRRKQIRVANAAEKMSWAATRETTREEDIAYCLLGLFGVNMPLLYGEGTNAFRRLQETIVRECFDPTLLAWNPTEDVCTDRYYDMIPRKSKSRLARFFDAVSGRNHPWYFKENSQALEPITFLARSPRCFLGCGSLIPCSWFPLDEELTTRGLSVTIPVSDNERPVAVLPCQSEHNPLELLALPLVPQKKSSHLRSASPLKAVSNLQWPLWQRKRVTLSTIPDAVPATWDSVRLYSISIRSCPPGVQLLDFFNGYEWVPARKLHRVPWRKFDPLNTVFLAADKSGNQFIILLAPPISRVIPKSFQDIFPSRLRERNAGGFVQPVNKAALDKIGPLIRYSSSELGASEYAEVPDGYLYMDIREEDSAMGPTLIVDIKSSTNKPEHAVSHSDGVARLLHLATRLLPTWHATIPLFHAKALLFYSFSFGLGLPIFGDAVRYTFNHVSSTVMGSPVNSMSIGSEMWHNIGRLHTSVLHGVVLYHTMPQLSWAGPGFSSFIRRMRGPLAIASGALSFAGALMARDPSLDTKLVYLGVRASLLLGTPFESEGVPYGDGDIGYFDSLQFRVLANWILHLVCLKDRTVFGWHALWLTIHITRFGELWENPVQTSMSFIVASAWGLFSLWMFRTRMDKEND